MSNQSFDSRTVLLQGTNLIEASAGTGKTYSIAILVLRLIVCEKLSIKDILMVTFTKAAVAELEERVRAFVRKAHRAALHQDIDDSLIRDIVQQQIKAETETAVLERLQQAVLLLDETSVMTIHGFCQQTLTEFAFETGQVFGAETLQDPRALVEDQVNRFWRKEVTTLPEPLLEALIDGGLSRALLINVVNQHLGGKRYLAYQETEQYDCNGDQHAKWMQELSDLRQKEQEFKDSVVNYVSKNRDKLLQASNTDQHARKSFSPLIDSPELWIELLQKKDKDTKRPGYLDRLFPEVLKLCSDCDNANDDLRKVQARILSHLYCMAISRVTRGVEEVKDRQNLIAFDDMIAKLHAALKRRPNPRLVEALRSRYKAVFIDEFQDTDRHQYEIFETAFGADTIVFYIGDPKQSIYAWRKADLQTYFKARNGVASVYEMNINYRSSGPYIDAMNEFFAVNDPFHFGTAADGIRYIDVEAPASSYKGTLMHNGVADHPISITEQPNKNAVHEALVADVIALLSPGKYQVADKEPRPIRPSDIGILVRAHHEAHDIKSLLARLGIPAVTIGEAKVLDAPEALMVWHFLVAMEEPSRGNINRALISPLTGFDSDTVLRLKEDIVTDLFRGFQKTWEESGVYTAMMNLVAAFNIRAQLLSGNSEAGERSITNLFQLIELIHKVQVRQGFSTLELIAWLKRGIDGMVNEGDEYEQRVESDEDSIKIVTIHKSKGLEYNIVLTPSLDQASNGEKSDTASFRDPGTNEYVSIERVNLLPEHELLMEEQGTQEKRRMLYVALTRAVYKCFIYKNTASNTVSNSTLNHFIAGRDFTSSNLIHRKDAESIPERYHYRSDATRLPSPLRAAAFQLEQINWRRVSYSSLAAKHEFRIRPSLGGANENYDRFMFYQLAKGAHTGNMLHFIFEQVQFSSINNWEYIISKAITQFAPAKRDAYAPLLYQMLETILQVPIRLGDTEFSLSQLNDDSRVHEFEFDFTIDHLEADRLNQLSNDSLSVAVKDQQQLEGLMNGLIDLLFEYNNKFYILDWKSNFLGDRAENYNEASLAEAMNENNYHLQYLLYTVAAKKYLVSRLGKDFNFETQFGGVIYLFVRGIRPGQTTGIFTTKPSVSFIDSLEAVLSNPGVEV